MKVFFSFVYCFSFDISRSPSSNLQKIVVKLAMEDENAKRRAFKLVAGIQGVDSVAVDMEENKITIIGDDPVYLTTKLRKLGSTELLSVGPAKEEKKKDNKDKLSLRSEKSRLLQKIVVKLAIEDEKAKRRAFKLVAGIEGVDSVAVDMKENKITIIGDADPVSLTTKLRKLGSTQLLSVGSAKEEKKEEKKDEKKESVGPAKEIKKEEKKDEKKEKKPQADAKKDNKGEKKEEKKPQADAKKDNKGQKKEEKKPQADAKKDNKGQKKDKLSLRSEK